MERREFMYEGKAKKIYTTADPDLVIVEFKDDATAFDGLKKGQITNKGMLNNKISSFFFKMLEGKGISSHFVRELSDHEMLVKKLQILKVEVVSRNIAAGSLAKRLGLEEGTPMSRPVLEFYYKDDALGDPMINEYHIYAMEFATPEQVEKIKKMSLIVNEVLVKFFLEHGLKLIDFKLEFGVYKGEVILADEISPDTCRLWDAVTNEKMDKDRFRRDLGGVEETYQAVLSRIQG